MVLPIRSTDHATRTAKATPSYLNFVALHEFMHSQGAVSDAAPHYGLNGHGTDDPRDLTYAGSLLWNAQYLDIGDDDDYKPNGLPAGLSNLAFSGF
jgi:hypothetical protein